MSTTGELQHTYNRLQSYYILLFLTCSYILIDNGMQTVNAELRGFMQRRKDRIERQKKQSLRRDKTLDKRRYTNIKHSGFAFSGATG